MRKSDEVSIVNTFHNVGCFIFDFQIPVYDYGTMFLTKKLITRLQLYTSFRIVFSLNMFVRFEFRHARILQ